MTVRRLRARAVERDGCMWNTVPVAAARVIHPDVLTEQPRSPKLGRRPHVVIAVVGMGIRETSAVALSLAHAAQSAGMETRVFRHCDAYPAVNPIPIALPDAYLPRVHIQAPRHELTIVPCPLRQPGVSPPVAPASLCDAAICILPLRGQSRYLNALLVSLRVADVELVAAVTTDFSTDDDDIRQVREQFYIHDFDGDAVPIRSLHQLESNPTSGSEALRLLGDLDHLPGVGMGDGGDGDGVLLTIGDVVRVKNNTDYAIVRLWQGTLYPGAKLELTGTARDHHVTTLVLQQRISMQAQPLEVGQLLLMHVQHRPGVRVRPGMLLFEPGSVARSRTCLARFDVWQMPGERVRLRVGPREVPAVVKWKHEDQRAVDEGRLATLSVSKPLHMPIGTTVSLLDRGVVVAVGKVVQLGELCDADKKASGRRRSRA